MRNQRVSHFTEAFLRQDAQAMLNWPTEAALIREQILIWWVDGVLSVLSVIISAIAFWKYGKDGFITLLIGASVPFCIGLALSSWLDSKKLKCGMQRKEFDWRRWRLLSVRSDHQELISRIEDYVEWLTQPGATPEQKQQLPKDVLPGLMDLWVKAHDCPDLKEIRKAVAGV